MNKRLLICTQKIDKHDPVLGFFHDWVAAFASRYESVIVICLEKGVYSLPDNVIVCSLGKETKQSRLCYIRKFILYAFNYRTQYDTVFVHMNEEYILLFGILWRLLGKRIALWRNHISGTWKTSLAVWLSHVVFYTSQSSFTARFKKGKIMPVGINEAAFTETVKTRDKSSILYVGRISPVKNIECLIEAFAILVKSGFAIKLILYGPVLDTGYMKKLSGRIKQSGIENSVEFLGPVLPENLPQIYSRYGVCVNMTNSGSFDKTIFESAMCKTFPVVSNKNFIQQFPPEIQRFISFEEGNPESFARTLKLVLSLPEGDYKSMVDAIATRTIGQHSLSVLMNALQPYL